VSGYGGKYLVNSYRDNDDLTGTLTSPDFTIHRSYIHFRIGGGNHPGKACINLVVDGQVVRTSTGKNNEKLEWDYWEVAGLHGRKAHIEIIDNAKGPWGHINIDDIRFGDEPPKEIGYRKLQDQADFGTLALSFLDEKAFGSPLGPGEFATTGRLPEGTALHFPLGEDRTGALVSHFRLAPGETREVVALVTWHFPGDRHSDHAYANWFTDAVDVARYLQRDLNRLTRLTRLFHDTYYDSTLPHWLLDRLLMPVSTLATNTCQWWRNGRFWAWEGVGCCAGTCTHVWNYAQAMGRLFPELERSVRTMQDLGPAFAGRTGRVGFRGEDPGSPYAADGQCGTVLKCYREHLMSADDAFLRNNWPRIKKVMEYAIFRDGNADGVIEDKQWNTFDLDFVGPNTFVGALYLAALKAADRMAILVGDDQFAEKCAGIARKGGAWASKHLWNGEYFIQKIPAGQLSRFQYGEGCLSDQLFGQNWAHQLDLGYLYPREQVQTALRSVYRYNWAPNVGAENSRFPPDRWFARPPDAGLLVCTWPKGGRMKEPVLYRDEVWTGEEYQVAAHMFFEGLIQEGLNIVRGIHDRYDGRRHNPWNEVECGDHYARALASWGCLLGLTGFAYDGPAGRLAFAPRWRPDNFKAFFSGAEGWGSLAQTRNGNTQENRIEMRYGKLRLVELIVEVPAAGAVTVKSSLQNRALDIKMKKDGKRVALSFERPLAVQENETLAVQLSW
jgi:hypothetical protein